MSVPTTVKNPKSNALEERLYQTLHIAIASRLKEKAPQSFEEESSLIWRKYWSKLEPTTLPGGLWKNIEIHTNRTVSFLRNKYVEHILAHKELDPSSNIYTQVFDLYIEVYHIYDVWRMVDKNKK